MKLALTTNGRLYRDSNGVYYTPIVYGYQFFTRYLHVFQCIKLIAHVEPIKDVNTSGMLRVDGPGIEVFEVAFPHGKSDYLKKFFSISKKTKLALMDCDACIVRIPDQLGFQVFHSARKANLPVGLEITSNSWEFFEKGSYNSPFRPFLRLLWDYEQKRACRTANATSYVTKNAIQKRYPPSKRKDTFTTNCSDVDTGKCEAKYRVFGTEPLKLIKCLHVSGSISGRAKGHKELIEAAALLKQRGKTLDIKLVGSGQLDSDLDEIVKSNELNVNLLGSLTPTEVANKMRENDLFIFPSYREGLPRVVVEAMASGMACVATNLDGIAELLDTEVLVPTMDSEALADKIDYLMNHPELLSIQSEENIETASDYLPEVLERKRTLFYEFIRKMAKE